MYDFRVHVLRVAGQFAVTVTAPGPLVSSTGRFTTPNKRWPRVPTPDLDELLVNKAPFISKESSWIFLQLSPQGGWMITCIIVTPS